ncbi:hypothetical protein QTP86_027817 [Hemibagrus guttatus]|nr:hypothetical protein QTP86_027817 [Hemibagrus guttatus]
MEIRKDILCVQETRWKGSKARSIGAGFKLFYYGVDSKRNGVGVVLKEEFVRNVLEVKRVSDRVMSLKLEIEGVMLNVVSGYAPQVGCELKEKERFWSELDEVIESIPMGERVVERILMDMLIVLPDDWESTADVIRETGRKVLGVSSGRRKEDKETWWWKEEVQDSIQRKRLAKKKWDMDRTEENRQEYKELQCRVKREVSKAKQKAYDELYTRLDTREEQKDLYRVLESEKMPEEWRRSVLVLIFKNKGDVQSCSNYKSRKCAPYLCLCGNTETPQKLGKGSLSWPDLGRGVEHLPVFYAEVAPSAVERVCSGDRGGSPRTATGPGYRPRPPKSAPRARTPPSPPDTGSATSPTWSPEVHAPDRPGTPQCPGRGQLNTLHIPNAWGVRRLEKIHVEGGADAVRCREPEPVRHRIDLTYNLQWTHKLGAELAAGQLESQVLHGQPDPLAHPMGGCRWRCRLAWILCLLSAL